VLDSEKRENFATIPVGERRSLGLAEIDEVRISEVDRVNGNGSREIDVSRRFRKKVFAMAITREIDQDIACVVRSVRGGGNSSGPR
jgi:hypothetical protein